MSQFTASAIVHAVGTLTIALLLGSARSPVTEPAVLSNEQPCVDLTPIVFPVGGVRRSPGGGGGGGGNRTDGSLQRAESRGKDSITLRARQPPPHAVHPEPPAIPIDPSSIPEVVLDSVPLASGRFEQIGLPSMNAAGTSAGPGSGGGVGTGVGTGIGSGNGPGIGRGSGGGIGGGTFRPGAAVTPPRLMTEVKPKYTTAALRAHLQGTVELELVVTREGRPSLIRVVGSLDPGGLDVEAVAAVAQWRFEPGRVAGAPVEVLVTVLLDFTIR